MRNGLAQSSCRAKCTGQPHITSLAAKLKSRELMAGIRKAERLASQCKYQNAEHRARAAELHLQIARTQQMAPSSDGTSVI